MKSWFNAYIYIFQNPQIKHLISIFYGIFGIWYGFTPHMIYMNSSWNLSLTYLSLSMAMFKYARGTSNIAISRPMYFSTTKIVIIASRDMVGDEVSSMVMTCSSPRRTFFLHALSFECTSKLCGTFLNQFLV